MTLKQLLTSTALTLAVAAPAFAYESKDTSAELETEIEQTADAAMEAGENTVDEIQETGSDIAAGASDMADDAADSLEAAGDDIADAAEEATDMVTPDTYETAGSDYSGMTVSEIVGLDVRSADGETVGEIDYIFNDAGTYTAVIGVGGFLGLGEYTVGLPLENFSMVDGEMILDATTESELKNMPEIDESELNELNGDYVIG